MKNKLVIVALLISSLMGFKLSAEKLPGTPVFGDDFSVLETFAENWDSKKGTKCENEQVSIPWNDKYKFSTLTLRRIPKGDFAFTADIIIEKPKGPKGGMFIIKLDGWINLLISVPVDKNQAGAHVAYKVMGEKRSRGNLKQHMIPGFKFGKPVKVMVSCVKVGTSHKYSYTVDGLVIDSFIVPVPKWSSGKIMFCAYCTSAFLDNFQLYTLKSDGSNNLVVNSSFEHLQEGMPLYINPATCKNVRFNGKYDDFTKAFSIDTNEKVSGKNSVRMTMDDKFPGSENLSSLPSRLFKNGVWTYNVSTILGKPITFSVYLKASEDNFPVQLTIWEYWYKGHKKKIKISKEWKRYSFTVDKLEKKAIVRGIVTFSHPGTVWADDMQIEIGDKPTKYLPSSLDKDKFADTKKAIEKNTILRKTAKAPVIDDGKECSSQAKRITLARKLELYTRYNYYMNEKNAVLVGSLNIPDANNLTGKITVVGKTIDVKMAPEFAFDIPLNGIKNGKHNITLDVYKGTEKLVTRSAQLIKRKFKKGATQIDHQRRCLVVDGKPYLTIMPHFMMEAGLAEKNQEAVLKNMLRVYKNMGYRCFLVTSKETPRYCKQKQAFYELCAKEGVKIINWSNTDYYKDDTKTAFSGPKKTFSTVTNDNIIAWMILDEPELGIPSDIAEAYLVSHQKASPYTPVFMNNTILGIPKRYANLKTDILMLDDYLTNREGRKVVEMIDSAEVMVKAGEEGRKPSFFFLVSQNLSIHYRELTYAEQVAQSYGVIIAGARGIGYFTGIPKYPEHYRACVDVNRELLELEEVILSLEKTSKATISDSIVKFMTQKLGDKIYIISLNSDNDRATDVEITLPAEFKYAKTAKVKFEDRTVEVKNGKIFDKYKPLERHVYIIDIVK